MIKTSINLYFNNTLSSEEKIKLIKELGYDEFFTGIYDETETLTLEEQIQFAKNLGLNCTMIHCSYYGLDIDSFWLDNEKGEEVLNTYIKQIRRSSGLSENFVVHLNDSYNCITSEIGLTRIRKLLEVCDECNINLCLENLFSREELPYVFNNIKHNRLKVCYDTGHRNFLTPDFNILKDFGKYISVLHMHDNYGEYDEHRVVGDGNIDWEDFAKEISKYPSIVLTAEIKPLHEDKDIIIYKQKEAFDNLKKLIK